MKILLVFLAGILIGALIVGAVWRGAGPDSVDAGAESAEVRISARKVLGGDIEFALQQRHAGAGASASLREHGFSPATAPKADG